MEVKTMKMWDEFTEENPDSCFYDFCKPGDFVGLDIFNHFLDIMPPIRFNKAFLQVGEPYSLEYNPKTEKHQSTYMTFIYDGEGVYKYCGNCFVGETDDYDTVVKVNQKGTGEEHGS